MTVEEALALVDKCIGEVKSRLVVSPPNFIVKIVDKDGARELVRRREIQPVIRADITPLPEAEVTAAIAVIP